MNTKSSDSTTDPTSTTTSSIATQILIAAAIALLAMSFTLPNFASRLFRPLSTRLGITADTAGGSAVAIPEGAEQATVAAGCFWGVEHLYRKHFGDKGLYDARVGYTGGDLSNPSYRAVCGGNTGRTPPSSPSQSTPSHPN